MSATYRFSLDSTNLLSYNTDRGTTQSISFIGTNVYYDDLNNVVIYHNGEEVFKHDYSLISNRNFKTPIEAAEFIQRLINQGLEGMNSGVLVGALTAGYMPYWDGSVMRNSWFQYNSTGSLHDYSKTIIASNGGNRITTFDFNNGSTPGRGFKLNFNDGTNNSFINLKTGGVFSLVGLNSSILGQSTQLSLTNGTEITLNAPSITVSQDATTGLEVVTYQQMTAGLGAYLPLAGNAYGTPITGNIFLSNASAKDIKQTDNSTYLNFIEFGTAGGIGFGVNDLSAGYGTTINFANATGIVVQAARPTFAGIRYDLDWSANFGARSIPDRAYNDGRYILSGSGVTSVTGTANRITSSGGTTPVIDINASYVGQASITTLGTLTTGATGAGFTVALGTSTITGTLTVSHGGTGIATTTAYGVITGGTTATGAFQNAGTGTSGQVLTSNGNAALATWATPTTGTVTSVSVTTNQGVSGVVATANTTPAITLSLGALTGVTSLNGLVITANTGVVTTGTWRGTPVEFAYGGTNANLTASNGGIFYSTATAGAILAGTATAGQHLQSGASAAPSWTTATFPSTATTTGAYLRADGTNWITSTLILPNAATSGRVAYTTATNTFGTVANYFYDTATQQLLIGTETAAGSAAGVHVLGASNTNPMLRVDVTGTTGQASIFSQNQTNGSYVQQDAFGSATAGTIAGINRTGMAAVRLGVATGGVGMISVEGAFAFNLATNSVVRLAVSSAGLFTMWDGGNLATGTTTGSIIFAAANNKGSFWGATPIIQPTTAVVASTFVANTSANILYNESTFDGYTLAQIVKALRNMGALA